MILTPGQLSSYDDLKDCSITDLDAMLVAGGFDVAQRAWIIRKKAEIKAAQQPPKGLTPP